MSISASAADSNCLILAIFIKIKECSSGNTFYMLMIKIKHWVEQDTKMFDTGTLRDSKVLQMQCDIFKLCSLLLWANDYQLCLSCVKLQ